MFCPRAGRSLQAQNLGCSSAEDRSSTANSRTMAAVLLGMNRRGSFPLLPHSTFSLASEQTLKILKRSQGHQRGGEDINVEVRRVYSANWVIRTSPKFTIRVKYQFHHGRLARLRKWRAYDVGEAKEGLENELWRKWSNGRVGKLAMM